MLPKKLNKETIIDSIVELRFETSLPNSVVFGILYNELKDDFPIVEELPVASLPENVRKQDPALAFQPLYRVKNDKFVVQIGSNVVAMSSFPVYQGWENFIETCQRVLQKVYALNIITSITRIGIRYINKFEGDITKNTNVSLNVSNISGNIGIANLIFKVNSLESNFMSRVQYGLEQTNKLTKNDLVTLIDIDTSCENIESFDYSYIWNKIEEGHYIGKKLFFDLLKQNYIESLEPTY